MTKHPSTAADFRAFGLIVGGILAAIGTWTLARGSQNVATLAALVIGWVLVVLGLSAPTLLAGPYRSWLQLAELLSVIATRVILGLVFFLLVTPIGLVRRLAGADPLRRRSAPEETYWIDYPARQRDPNHYEKMY